MKSLKLLVAAAAIAFASAPALAQSSAMDAAMAPYFMDKEMKKMKTMDEMKAAYTASSSSQKEMLAKDCANQNSMHATFCQSFNEINNK